MINTYLVPWDNGSFLEILEVQAQSYQQAQEKIMNKLILEYNLPCYESYEAFLEDIEGVYQIGDIQEISEFL